MRKLAYSSPSLKHSSLILIGKYICSLNKDMESPSHLVILDVFSLAHLESVSSVSTGCGQASEHMSANVPKEAYLFFLFSAEFFPLM